MELLRRGRWRVLSRCRRLVATAAGEGGAGGAEAEAWPRRLVAGLQPTGALHVGNYFGCVQRLVRAQQQGEDVTVFVADLHALTACGAGSGSGAGSGLGERSLELAAYLMASGLEPARGVLFVQSAVPRHAELCWVLACLATQPRLAQLPQYRERAAAPAAGGERLGALLYPVLQAADVLVYRGTHVPVGADQLQHLQLAAHLARAFTRRYGRAFPEPRALLPEDGVGGERVRSLRAPDRKMSKSDPDARSRLLLSDDDATLRLKVRKAVTDCSPRVTYEPAARPGVSNLVALHCLARPGLAPEDAVEEAALLTTAQYKAVVSEAVCAAVGPVRARAQALLARPGALRAALRAGAARARARADETYEHVARLVGLAPHALRDPKPDTERDTEADTEREAGRSGARN